MDLGDDGAMPDLASCTRQGDKPIAFVGSYTNQVDAAINYVRAKVSLADETVAFLHPKGGGWFDFLRSCHGSAISFADKTSEWPDGPENVALSTFHSARLEFDHVIALGLNAETTTHGNGDGDAQLENLRRLLAMGIGRARKTVILGFINPESNLHWSRFSTPPRLTRCSYDGSGGNGRGASQVVALRRQASECSEFSLREP